MMMTVFLFFKLNNSVVALDHCNDHPGCSTKSLTPSPHRPILPISERILNLTLHPSHTVNTMGWTLTMMGTQPGLASYHQGHGFGL